MDPIIIALIGVGVMFLLIVLQVPIGISMAMVGLAGVAIFSGVYPALTLLSTEISSTISNFNLAIIPLFVLMGSFASVAGLSDDVYSLANALVGHYRGGLALSTITGCGFFGAICGSSPATAATFGRVALPEMLKRNYSKSFGTGCIAAGGTLGSLVPPSVLMVIYAVMAEEFILDMFVAAIIPSIMEILLYVLTIMIWVTLIPGAGPASPRMSWRERLQSITRCWGALLIAFIVLGGIYGGFFTVNEAAAFGAASAFLFAIGRFRMTKEAFWQALTETAVTAGMIYVILVGAGIFTYFMTLSEMPDAIVTLITNLDIPDVFILSILLLVLLILGSVFDTLSAMLITLPFILPIVINMGYSPIWWGIINVVVIEMGMITPPIGINVFVLHGVTRVPLSVIYKGVFPFLIADLFRLAILVIFPNLILWLPNLMD